MKKKFLDDDYLLLYKFKLLLQKTSKVILLNIYTLVLLMVLSIGISYYFSTQQIKKFETQISIKKPNEIFFALYKTDGIGLIEGSPSTTITTTTTVSNFFFNNFLSNINSRDNVEEFLSIYNSSNSPVVPSFTLREADKNTYALIFYEGVDGVKLLNEYIIWTKKKH